MRIIDILLTLIVVLALVCIYWAYFKEPTPKPYTPLVPSTAQAAPQPNEMMLGDREVTIIVLDSCQWLVSGERTSSVVLAHRGRCEFCAQRALARK